MSFKPLLASPVNLDTLLFPVLASYKLDGVRAIVRNGVVLSRTLKPIPNLAVQRKFGKLEHFDGELIVGHPNAVDCYRQTVSTVMTVHASADNVVFFAFDHVKFPEYSFTNRHALLCSSDHSKLKVVFLPQVRINSLDVLLQMETTALELGYEGLILRDGHASYKFGRSTTKEGILLKLKRFTDAEFVVAGFEERLENCNPAFTNELGRTAHSHHKDNKLPRGDLGALVLHHPNGTFNCGTGFTDAERLYIWERRGHYIGKIAKVKFFNVGGKDFPRHPVFLGWRDQTDM